MSHALLMRTALYGHNGYFKTLEEIVHFYNVRDVSNEFRPAEYPATVNKDELGNLGLTSEEEQDLIAFMKTLTDGYYTHKGKTKKLKITEFRVTLFFYGDTFHFY